MTPHSFIATADQISGLRHRFLESNFAINDLWLFGILHYHKARISDKLTDDRFVGFPFFPGLRQNVIHDVQHFHPVIYDGTDIWVAEGKWLSKAQFMSFVNSVAAHRGLILWEPRHIIKLKRHCKRGNTCTLPCSFFNDVDGQSWDFEIHLNDDLIFV